MAGVSMLKGLYHWAIVCGIDAPTAGGFADYPTPYQSATAFFAVIDLVAAVGLWLAAPWGAVVWLTSAVSLVVIGLLFQQLFGQQYQNIVVALEGAAIRAYLLLSIHAAREHPEAADPPEPGGAGCPRGSRRLAARCLSSCGRQAPSVACGWDRGRWFEEGLGDQMARIGFIGLGNMGLPMAQNLLKAGHTVAGVDVSSAAVDKLKASGGTGVETAKSAAARADVVITMLPSGKEVREVYLGSSGIIENANAGTLLIDCSTIDVETSRAVASKADKKGLLMLDAPVSGGVGGATAATLTFMVGGSAQAFTRAESILQKMGKTIVHAGGAGNGQAAKICNNMILGVSMIAVSEAFVLAEKLGLDHQKLFDISSKSSGQCWSMTTYCPVPGPVPT